MKTKLIKIAKNVVPILVVIIFSALITFEKGSLTLPAIFSKICIFIIAALSLNIICGNLGELVIGHGGLVLIGFVVSFVITYLTKEALYESLSRGEVQGLIYSVSKGLQPAGYLFIIGVTLVAGLITGIIGLIIGLIVMGRLKGDYLAIVTLGIGLIIVCVIQNMSFTDKAGNVIVGTQNLNNTTFIQGNPLLYATYMICILVVCVLFITSRFGRGIISIREDYIAAEASGIPVIKYKVMAFTFSALLAGIAGSLYSFYSSQIASTFNQDMSIELMLMIVLGGLGSYTGTIIAVPLMIIFNQYILIDLPQQFSNNPKIIYGAVLVLIMLFRNEGIFGTKEFSWDGLNKVLHKIFKRKKKIVSTEVNNEQ